MKSRRCVKAILRSQWTFFLLLVGSLLLRILKRKEYIWTERPSVKSSTKHCWTYGFKIKKEEFFLCELWLPFEKRDFCLFFFRNYSVSLGMSPQIWIGLFRTTEASNDFEWVDGTPFVLNNMSYFQTWFGSQPNNDGAACVRIKLAKKKWRDKDCSSFY